LNADVPSAALRFGWVSLGIGVMATIGSLFTRGPGMDLEGARLHEVIFVFLIPYLLGPCLALGTIGAAFAEGVTKPRSWFGMLLSAVGAAVPWVVWEILCLGAS
jgi:hypothetical protein